MWQAGGGGGAASHSPPTPRPPHTRRARSQCTAAQYEALAKEVVGAVSGDDAQQAGPTVQRASFHACGTWSQSAQNGGCSGAWHRFAEDMDFPENAGLHEVRAWGRVCACVCGGGGGRWWCVGAVCR